MRASVTDVLAVPAVRSAAPVVLGGDEFLERKVRWLHTTDGTDLSGLLKGSEMILTAGESFADNQESATAYFRNLVENHASGVMVSLLTGDPEAKAVLRAAAQTAGLPVILLRDRVPFVELTEAVHRVLLAVDQVAGSEADPTFLIDRLSVEQVSPAAILRRASELLIAPVVYEDRYHRVVAYATAGMPAERLLANWRQYSRGIPSSAHQDSDEWLQVSYREQGEVAGRLVVPMRLTDPLAPIMLERAAQVLEHCYANLDESGSSRFRAVTGAFRELRSAHVIHEDSVYTRAAASGVERAEVYLPVVFHVGTSDKEAASASLLECDALQLMYEVALERKMTLLAAPLAEHVVGGVMVMPAEESARAQLQVFVGELDRECGGALSRGTGVLALGPSSGKLHEAVTGGVDEAWEISEAAMGMGARTTALVTAGDVRLRRLLQSMSDEPHLRTFVAESLSKLKVEGNDYLRILRAYIELNGNIAEVARTVYLSRPSVYARLNRIEEFIGSNLSNVDTRTGLYIALLADAHWETRSPTTS